MFSPWYETDPGCCQHIRKDESVYEMIQAIWLDRTEEDIEQGYHEYCICKGEIDLNSYEDDDVLSAIHSYGYSIVSLLETYGDTAPSIIAECILEEEIMRDSCVIADADTFEEAKEIIEKIIN